MCVRREKKERPLGGGGAEQGGTEERCEFKS